MESYQEEEREKVEERNPKRKWQQQTCRSGDSDTNQESFETLILNMGRHGALSFKRYFLKKDFREAKRRKMALNLLHKLY